MIKKDLPKLLDEYKKQTDFTKRASQKKILDLIFEKQDISEVKLKLKKQYQKPDLRQEYKYNQAQLWN